MIVREICLRFVEVLLGWVLAPKQVKQLGNSSAAKFVEEIVRMGDSIIRSLDLRMRTHWRSVQ